MQKHYYTVFIFDFGEWFDTFGATTRKECQEEIEACGYENAKIVKHAYTDGAQELKAIADKLSIETKLAKEAPADKTLKPYAKQTFRRIEERVKAGSLGQAMGNYKHLSNWASLNNSKAKLGWKMQAILLRNGYTNKDVFQRFKLYAQG